MTTDLSAETDGRIQLSSIKPDIKSICKNVNQCASSNFIAVENINLLFTLICNDFTTIFKWSIMFLKCGFNF